MIKKFISLFKRNTAKAEEIKKEEMLTSFLSEQKDHFDFYSECWNMSPRYKEIIQQKYSGIGDSLLKKFLKELIEGNNPDVKLYEKASDACPELFWAVVSNDKARFDKAVKNGGSLDETFELVHAIEVGSDFVYSRTNGTVRNHIKFYPKCTEEKREELLQRLELFKN